MHLLLKQQLQETGVHIDEARLTLLEHFCKQIDKKQAALEDALQNSEYQNRKLRETFQNKLEKKLKVNEIRYERLVHELREQYFFYTYDNDFRFTDISNSVTDILGYDKDEVLGEHFMKFYTDDSINQISLEASDKQRKGEKAPSRIVSVYHKNGEVHYLEIDSYPVMDENGKFLIAEGIAKDITKQFTIQKELDYLSSHDVLTGLTNRYSLNNQLEYIINDSKRNNKNFSLFYIDLDNFKLVNDTFGHHEGDLLLQNIAKELKKHIRENDILARIGGDEFVIVYTNITNKDKSRLAEIILERIYSVLSQEQKLLDVSASIGISTYPQDGDDMDILLKCADSAMYTTKQQGKSGYSIY